ncbi:uncharacterized protein YbjT (DUF2867 family) [Kineosphaera limosa]|uniref:NAD(P)-binding domain-containing protein n=1 Tax=Kineosphaera limosa NBRC 100340 TaxID=1184609 RepID=K6VQ89_9MICO|nr:SDR family oxidoreductase [Kineosphaera limosa]NYE00819.1 uncharacterized protein YbjT (DUF2867 family) [Kineosphaera limosa]GAB98353.1 hypothetical protein KILIM_134_00020 [Kineosphaera limosa NBRC 100340]
MTPLRIVVLGGTGTMGRRVADRLSDRGHDVVRASRSSGVDVADRRSLEGALAGADVVVDAINVETLSRRRAVDVLGSGARNVSRAAQEAGVGHIVCLSIVGAADPAVSGALGYYAGKAAQEAVYRSADVPVTLALTTQWFDLARTFLHQVRVGPVAIVPAMRCQPVHTDAAAEFVTAIACGPAPDRVAVAELAGPEQWDSAGMALRLARVIEPSARVVRVPMPARALRTGGLLPGPRATIDGRRFEDWLETLG